MQDMDAFRTSFQRAAEEIRTADALLIGAGAGMGVDSGLPDFRGREGFWKAYPAFKGRDFTEMSNPVWFRKDPTQAWGFFGHRWNLYRSTQPHGGFEILRKWQERYKHGSFVFTSNVDGQFQKAGFPKERILECHGSIHFLQCSQPCCREIWSEENLQIEVDRETVKSTSPLPTCPNCEAVARPNILMFGDYDWIETRANRQMQHYREWLRSVAGGRIVAIELGAGTAIPTVRYECERQADVLIRINPRDNAVPSHGISLPFGALKALTKLNELLEDEEPSCEA